MDINFDTYKSMVAVSLSKAIAISMEESMRIANNHRDLIQDAMTFEVTPAVCVEAIRSKL